jgi:hypothetical protein
MAGFMAEERCTDDAVGVRSRESVDRAAFDCRASRSTGMVTLSTGVGFSSGCTWVPCGTSSDLRAEPTPGTSVESFSTPCNNPRQHVSGTFHSDSTEGD